MQTTTILNIFLAGNDQLFSVTNRLVVSPSGTGQVRRFIRQNHSDRWVHDQPHLREANLREIAQFDAPQRRKTKLFYFPSVVALFCFFSRATDSRKRVL